MIKKKKMTIDDLAVKMDDVASKMDTFATKADVTKTVDNAVGKLAIMVQEGFTETVKQVDLISLTERVVALEKEVHGMHGNFDMVFQQLKEIKNELKEVDARADVVDLQLRVNKLEKKVKL